MTDTQQIILRVRSGDIEAYGELVRIHQAGVRACLLVRLQDATAADDLAQEAFLIAYRKLADFDAQRDFGPWVRSIAIRCLQNHLRKKRPYSVGAAAELEQLVDSTLDRLHPVEHSETEQQLAALQHCLEQLDSSQRTFIERRYLLKQSIDEIKTAAGLAHSTVTMRLHRLREELRTCIEARTT